MTGYGLGMDLPIKNPGTPLTNIELHINPKGGLGYQQPHRLQDGCAFFLELMMMHRNLNEIHRVPKANLGTPLETRGSLQEIQRILKETRGSPKG